MANYLAPTAKPNAQEKQDTPPLPQIKLFKDANFQGDCLTCYGDVNYVGDDWNDTCSSIIVVNGYWQCYNDSDFRSPSGPLIGPGGYNAPLEQYNIGNDVISSVKFFHY